MTNTDTNSVFVDKHWNFFKQTLTNTTNTKNGLSVCAEIFNSKVFEAKTNTTNTKFYIIVYSKNREYMRMYTRLYTRIYVHVRNNVCCVCNRYLPFFSKPWLIARASKATGYGCSGLSDTINALLNASIFSTLQAICKASKVVKVGYSSFKVLLVAITSFVVDIYFLLKIRNITL